MERILSVSQLNKYIKGVFEDELILQNINVIGEIYEFKIAANNSYIVLKDGSYTLRCVYFSSMVEYKVGQKVCVQGTVSFYPKSGSVSFIISSIKVTGRGEILELLEKTKKLLVSEGTFSNRRQLPVLVKDVALITSSEGAVMHDFLEVAKPMHYLNIKIFSSKVQGEGADRQMINILSDIDSGKHGKFDAVVLARGGGSTSDLSEFNSADLARKIHQCKVPVISAIGHETDYTFIDYAADIRAGTPSIAAAMILENNSKYFDRLFFALNCIKEAVTMDINQKSRRLQLSSVKGMEKVLSKNRKAYYRTVYYTQSIKECVINKHKEELQNCERVVKEQFDVINQRIEKGRHRIMISQAKIEQLNPKNILAKGFAKIYKKNKAVLSIKNLNKGEDIEILMYDGKTDAKIN